MTASKQASMAVFDAVRHGVLFVRRALWARNSVGACRVQIGADTRDERGGAEAPMAGPCTISLPLPMHMSVPYAPCPCHRACVRARSGLRMGKVKNAGWILKVLCVH